MLIQFTEKKLRGHRAFRASAGKSSSIIRSAARLRAVLSQKTNALRLNRIPSITTCRGKVIEYKSIMAAENAPSATVNTTRRSWPSTLAAPAMIAVRTASDGIGASPSRSGLHELHETTTAMNKSSPFKRTVDQPLFGLVCFLALCVALPRYGAATMLVSSAVVVSACMGAHPDRFRGRSGSLKAAGRLLTAVWAGAAFFTLMAWLGSLE